MAANVERPPCEDDIVISGMSGQFPNSHNVKEYIEQLLNKVHLCDDDERRGKIQHPEIPKVIGKVYDLDQFDAGHFGVHGLHAKFTEPMGRMLLEQVYSALFDAGVHPEELKGSQTGVFTGCCFSEYEQIWYSNLPEGTRAFTGATRSMSSQKVSYYLQVNGPAYNSDTACSSGMYSLEEAYRAIREGRCDCAIVAGTNLCTDPYVTLQFARLGVLNMGGGCRPFDNDASGYTRSEAIVAIILQKRSEAKRIYGTLVHTETNDDGYKSMGITYPSSKGQLQLLQNIYNKAQIIPKQIGFLEAHGTGTKVGDPEELSAIDNFYKPTKEQPLLIGSVKGNIGHSEPSAGLCSLVKVLHALNSGQIAPNIHFDKPRDSIEGLIDGRLKVVTDVTPFPEDKLYAATGYIYHVWKFFADIKKTEQLLLNLVFENVKFHRACTISGTLLELGITITRGGYFEVTENDSIVVTGTVKLAKEQQFNIEQVKQNSEDLFVLSTKDAYRELRLRGYNYSGQFRAIQEVTPTSATIKWEREWITFLDNMMQVCILLLDTRNLYVPVAIDRMVIHPRKHFDEVSATEDGLVKVCFDKDTQTVKSRSVEICGLTAKAIARRKERLQPVLESYQFVPNEVTTDFATSIRINIQLLLECKPCNSFKVAELIADDDEPDNIVISHICNAIEDLPVVIPHLTVVTTRQEFEVPNCKTANKLPEENLLIICKHPNKSIYTDVDKALTIDGFVLCLAGPQQTFPGDYTILTKHTINNDASKNDENQSEILYFLRKRHPNKAARKTINISNSKDMLWLKDVQAAVKTSSEVVLLAQNDHKNGILGFTNCLNREPGMENVSCVFLQDNSVKFDENNNSDELLQKQLYKQMKINVFKDGQWGTYRHLVLGDADKVPSYHWHANTQKPGDLSSLAWVQGHIMPENKESPKILCSALNFRDLMLASGKLSLDTISKDRLLQTNQLGLEFVSIDSRGKRMCSMGTYGIGNMSDHVYLTYDVPDDWTTEEAATILIVYSTVVYSLIEKGQLQRGQSVLIHSGAGGVGLAAINVCTYFECNIFVTVGTQDKRDYLIEHYPNIKPSQIGNSRNTTFREMIMHETNGKGVDVVLNSLAEEKLQASLDCLAYGGVFLEIGKYDLEKNNDLTLELAIKECRYIGIMLDSCVNQNGIVDKIATLLKNGIRDGYVKPLPRTVFQIDELEKACKYMSTGKHIGKVLIKIDHERKHKVIPRYYCDPTKTYIIFGGLGGFGLELADWLILRGARHIVLSSRKGITTGYQRYRISIWKTYGVKISILMEDVTNYDTCYKVLKDLHKSVPIDGIFNLAVVLSDAVFENQTIETMKISMQPKAVLTQHLDTVTRKICPQMKSFVVFSSVSCGRGNAGQTNYGYANSVMERICEQRHLDGLPALAVQWGAVGDVGLLESLQKERNEIAIGGTLQQKVGNCLEVLDKLLLQKHPIVSSMVVAEKFNRLAADCPLQAVSLILGINDIKSVSPHTTFPELGMDSMMAVEIKQILEREYDISITPNDLRNLTFAKLEELRSNSTASGSSTGHIAKESVVSLVMMLPIIQLSSRKEQIVDFNQEASKVPGDFVVVFPGIDAEVNMFENMSKSLGRHFKVVDYDNISTNQENVDVIVDYVYNAVKYEIESYKTFQLIAHSIGNLSAIELVRRFESNGIFGKLIFIDGAPDLMYKLLETHENEEDLEANLIRTIAWNTVPELDISELDKILATQKNFTDRVEAAVSEYLNDSEELRNLATRLMHCVHSRLMSVSEYKARQNCTKIQSDVCLFKPNTDTIKDIADDYNLGACCENVKLVDSFDGNHLTMLHNAKLHQALSAELNNSLNLV